MVRLNTKHQTPNRILKRERKILEFRNALMILVPEKPTSLRSAAIQAKKIFDKEHNVVVVVAEGFMPPEGSVARNEEK